MKSIINTFAFGVLLTVAVLIILTGAGGKVAYDWHQGSSDFYLEIVKGWIPGHSVVHKFAENSDVDTAAGEDIWGGGGLYTWATTAGTWYVSSSDAGDTQSVQWELLTEDSGGDWNHETVTVTLVGQTKTAIAPASGDGVIRVWRGENKGTTDFAGTVYLYEDDTETDGVPDTASKIKAVIVNGDNQTLMSQYTVPSGFVGFLQEVQVALGSGVSPASAVAAVFTWRQRTFGSVFRVQDKAELISNGNGVILWNHTGGTELSAKTDILVRCESTTANDTGVVCDYDVVLVRDDP